MPLKNLCNLCNRWTNAFFLLFLAILCLWAVASLAPLPVPYYQDFSVMYFTNQARLHGIPIYDYPAQLAYLRPLTPPGFEFLPYPYPPWYALATLWIGLLPIQAAARAWFLLNAAVFALCGWMLARRWPAPWRMLAVPAALMFLPVFGLLVVGQYSAPVLLGAALFLAAARRQNPALAALALLLLTYKPHIGALPLLAGLAWLLAQRQAWARRAALLTLLGGLGLALLGLLADPAWPLTWLGSLELYRALPGVQTCGQCVSLPVVLLQLLTGRPSLTLAAGLAVALALPVGVLLGARYRIYMKEPGFLMSLAVLLGLLLDPYLLNYDYVLLLLPLFWLARPGKWTWLLGAAYLLPWGVLVFGRSANGLLAVCGVVTFVLLLLNPIDAPPGEAYNHSESSLR